MPQLFPMNWIILSIMFAMILISTFVNIYFFPLNKKIFFLTQKSKKNFYFKW
uniref:ATP synthase F0 subunit 8 n=1 Tax=Ixodes ovatus TaxID=59652 RepID=UPI001FAF0635|nr:ATP synthase F0 subunit 8 [Ixodes ovatus]UNO53692.1 ATP synthase F0 subunit 8 [Ixodes ovatus]